MSQGFSVLFLFFFFFWQLGMLSSSAAAPNPAWFSICLYWIFCWNWLSQVISPVVFCLKADQFGASVWLGDLRNALCEAGAGRVVCKINGNCPLASGLFPGMSQSVSNQKQFYYWKSYLSISIHILPLLVSNGRGKSMEMWHKGIFSHRAAVISFKGL